MATKITVNNNGSLIEGEIEIYDGAGNKYDLAGRTIISLCRCGQSNNKPFCDGSHALWVRVAGSGDRARNRNRNRNESTMTKPASTSGGGTGRRFARRGRRAEQHLLH